MIPRPFEIAHSDGCAVATDGRVVLSVRDNGKAWRRRGLKTSSGEVSKPIGAIEMAVGELKDVRVYVTHADGQVHIILTTEDIWP